MTTAADIERLPESIQASLRERLIRSIRESAHSISEALGPIEMQDWAWDDLIFIGESLVRVADRVQIA